MLRFRTWTTSNTITFPIQMEKIEKWTWKANGASELSSKAWKKVGNGGRGQGRGARTGPHREIFVSSTSVTFSSSYGSRHRDNLSREYKS